MTASYTRQSTNPLRPAAVNNAAAFTNVGVSNQSGPRPADVTPPERSGMPYVDENSDGESVLTIEYNEGLDAANPGTNAFTVTVDCDEVEIDEVEVGSASLALTLASPVYSGQTVTVSHTVPTDFQIRDETFNPAPAFSGVAVTNNSDPLPDMPPPPTDNTPSQLSEDPAEGVSVLGTELILVYNEDLDQTSTLNTSRGQTRLQSIGMATGPARTLYKNDENSL